MNTRSKVLLTATIAILSSNTFAQMNDRAQMIERFVILTRGNENPLPMENGDTRGRQFFKINQDCTFSSKYDQYNAEKGYAAKVEASGDLKLMQMTTGKNFLRFTDKEGNNSIKRSVVTTRGGAVNNPDAPTKSTTYYLNHLHYDEVTSLVYKIISTCVNKQESADIQALGKDELIEYLRYTVGNALHGPYKDDVQGEIRGQNLSVSACTLEYRGVQIMAPRIPEIPTKMSADLKSLHFSSASESTGIYLKDGQNRESIKVTERLLEGEKNSNRRFFKLHVPAEKRELIQSILQKLSQHCGSTR